MKPSLLDEMTYEQRYLVNQAVEEMDRHYDDAENMLREGKDRHGTRESAHYALGLLIRNAPGDAGRAFKVLGRVLDMQFDFPEEIYHGTFKTAPQAPNPPSGNFPWKSFAPGFAFFLDDTFRKVGKQLAELAASDDGGADPTAVKLRLQEAVDRVLPPVWKSYDPNWREFIACTFAVILEHFEEMLPAELVSRMDESMLKTVDGSIGRRLSDAIPMNTNIELMHMFICDYYGHRFDKEDWKSHAEQQARRFLDAFNEFGSFAEFNTTTYYGVDLTVLGLLRKYGKSDAIIRTGREVEKGLWENIALFYNPSLENLSGPFSRAYEMEMLAHSSIGVFLFLALGKGYEHLAGVNCETSHDPMIALVGVNVPENVLPALVSHQGDRLVSKQFRELCERDKPGANSNLCTAVAWIEENLMIGAMSGSRNTNGQLHPATIHWKTGEGDKYYLRLLRREAGGHWNTHLRGITYEARTEKDLLAVDVRFDTDEEIELYFEIEGKRVRADGIAKEVWSLPDLTLQVDADAPAPTVCQTEDGIEVVYRYRPGSSDSRMSFTLRKIG